MRSLVTVSECDVVHGDRILVKGLILALRKMGDLGGGKKIRTIPKQYMKRPE